MATQSLNRELREYIDKLKEEVPKDYEIAKTLAKGSCMRHTKLVRTMDKKEFISKLEEMYEKYTVK